MMPVLSCLFAALISGGAYIAIPVPGSPVPVVLQNMFILLAGLLLGPVWGLGATSLYLLLGALGLPVFSGGTGGIARLAGPTGGYLAGYLPAVVVVGLLSGMGRPRIWKNVLACTAGSLVVYLAGVTRLRGVLDTDWTKALAVGFLPFVPGDILKIAMASLLAARLSGRLDSLSRGEGAGRG